MLTKQQLRDRKTGIGGSDVASVLNLPPYGCARRLWYDKRDYPEDYPVLINKNMERGSRLEPLIKEIFQEETEYILHDVKQKVHSARPFMLCNLDAMIVGDLRGPGVLEIKCPARDMFFKIKREGIPEAYILQMQHNLDVWNIDWGVFFIFNADLWDWIPCEVKVDYELADMIIGNEEKFWRMVENGPTPDALEIGDKRCKSCAYRKTCWGPLDEYQAGNDKEDPEIPDLSEDKKYVEAVNDYTTARDVLKEAELLKEDARARLLKIMGKRTAVRGAGAKIYYKPSVRTYWDLEALENSFAFLKPKFEKTVPVKKFNLYKTGE